MRSSRDPTHFVSGAICPRRLTTSKLELLDIFEAFSFAFNVRWPTNISWLSIFFLAVLNRPRCVPCPHPGPIKISLAFQSLATLATIAFTNPKCNTKLQSYNRSRKNHPFKKSPGVDECELRIRSFSDSAIFSLSKFPKNDAEKKAQGLKKRPSSVSLTTIRLNQVDI